MFSCADVGWPLNISVSAVSIGVPIFSLSIELFTFVVFRHACPVEFPFHVTHRR